MESKSWEKKYPSPFGLGIVDLLYEHYVDYYKESDYYEESDACFGR